MVFSFEIKGEYIDLVKLLKATDLCPSGGIGKLVVEDGLVRVDGVVEHRKRRKIRKGQRVEFDGHEVHVK